MDRTRTESDSLGRVDVPSDAYYGAQTERAKRNFPVSGRRLPRAFVAALGLIKREAAIVHGEMGRLDAGMVAAIVAAANEVIAGKHDRDFVVDVFQTGSGTSTHMNANEVIANRAIEILGGTVGSREPVHPNDHVNAGQSSNDVIPTAIHLAAYGLLVEELQPALEVLATTFEERAAELDDVVKIGRTHLQDAVPIRLGQELGGYAQQLRYGLARVEGALPRLAELALGGTAVGTGLNAPPGFADRVIARLAAATGHPFVPAGNRFEALAARDAAVEVSGVLKTVAVSLFKIANDLRWLASGPRAGLCELELPNLQPGSSIMPGKVNPVLPEAVMMVAAQVMGNDVTISIAGMNGNFELNTMMPVLAANLLESIQILASSSRLLAEHCVRDLKVRVDRMGELVEQSLALVTALAPRIGYDAAAEIAKEAWASQRTIREVCLERGLFTEAELAELLDARSMTEGEGPAGESDRGRS